MKDLFDKVSTLFLKITEKFDGISDRLYETTGKKINIGAIVLGAMLIIFLLLFVKTLLSWLLTLL